MSFSWQHEQQSAFEELKGHLVSAPVLAYPSFSAEAMSFILDTDASQYQGIGAAGAAAGWDGAGDYLWMCYIHVIRWQVPVALVCHAVFSRLPHGQEDNEKDMWLSENVARAQSEDPDIGPVIDQLLREWKKPTDEELRRLSRATREVWVQWEPLELREGVLYLQSPERNPSVKSMMVLPQKLVKRIAHGSS